MNVKCRMVTNVVMQDELFRRHVIEQMQRELRRANKHPKRIRFEKVPAPKTGKHFQTNWQNYYIEVFYD